MPRFRDDQLRDWWNKKFRRDPDEPPHWPPGPEPEPPPYPPPQPTPPSPPNRPDNPYEGGLFDFDFEDIPIYPFELPEGEIPMEWYVAPPTGLESLGYRRASEIAGSPYYYALMEPAIALYGEAVRGAFSPLGQYFRRQVYEPTREEALLNLERAQKEMARKFASKGGYFGGRHALAEAELARGTLSDLNRLLGELQLEGHKEDISTRFAGARGLEGITPTLRGLEWQDVFNLLQTGGRERGMRQLFLDLVREDVMRSRQEQMLPFQMALSLLGVRAFEPVMMEPRSSPWAYLLGGIGQVGSIYGLTKLLPLLGL